MIQNTLIRFNDGALQFFENTAIYDATDGMIAVVENNERSHIFHKDKIAFLNNKACPVYSIIDDSLEKPASVIFMPETNDYLFVYKNNRKIFSSINKAVRYAKNFAVKSVSWQYSNIKSEELA